MHLGWFRPCLLHGVDCREYVLFFFRAGKGKDYCCSVPVNEVPTAAVFLTFFLKGAFEERL